VFTTGAETVPELAGEDAGALQKSNGIVPEWSVPINGVTVWYSKTSLHTAISFLSRL